MKIFAYNIAVDRNGTQDEIGAFGKFLPKVMKIQIANDLCQQQAESTLLHEIVEAVNTIMKLDLGEQAIMILEASFYQILTENGIDLSELGNIK
jgi:hypothetical protein